MNDHIDFDSGSLRATFGAQIILQSDTTYGFFELTWDHTVAFESITFVDGSTPESHGFEVVLASGLPSPNLVVESQPAPEPSALLLAALGLVGLGFFRLRGKFRRA